MLQQTYLLTAIAIATAGTMNEGGCEARQRGERSMPLGADTTPSSEKETTSVSDMARLCEATIGQFNSSLLACYCPDGSVFSVLRGCTKIENINITRSSIGNFFIGTKPGRSTPAGPEEAVLSMPGLTVEGESGSKASILINFGSVTPVDVDLDLELPLQGAANAITVNYSPMPPSQEDTNTSCLGVMEQLSAFQAKSVCSIVSHTIKVLREGKLLVDFQPKTIGSGRAQWQLFVAEIPSSNFRGTLNIVSKSGCFVLRILRLNFGDNLEAKLLLTPAGDVMAGRLRVLVPLEKHEHAILRERRFYVGAHLSPIEARTDDFGDKNMIRRHLMDWYASSNSDASLRLPADGRLPSILAPLRAMVLESSLGLAVPALTNRMDIDRSAVEEFLVRGTINRPIRLGFSPTSRLQAHWDLASEDLLGNHGSLVSMLLAADLPNVKISWLPTSFGGWTSNPQRARVFISEEISRCMPQVVNISETFQDDFPSCIEVFDPIFRRFSDSTLFVVAAGNDGAYNSTSTCPGGIAHRYRNVISVGGVDQYGDLHPMSNFGPNVDIVAPYAHSVEKAEGGTSFAAPVVANAALRLWGRYPWLSAPDIKEILLDACKADSLDVLCGGALDVQRLEYETKWEQ